jgi:hypothetical protein
MIGVNLEVIVSPKTGFSIDFQCRAGVGYY